VNILSVANFHLESKGNVRNMLRLNTR